MNIAFSTELIILDTILREVEWFEDDRNAAPIDDARNITRLGTCRTQRPDIVLLRGASADRPKFDEFTIPNHISHSFEEISYGFGLIFALNELAGIDMPIALDYFEAICTGIFVQAAHRSSSRVSVGDKCPSRSLIAVPRRR